MTDRATHPHVTLVGAGPGDPELLTLKALKALQSASVVLVDDLVSDAILALANPAARVIRVGKRGGCRSTPQTFIHKLMIQAALDGENVVRLKGGDPLIFGRGGEEVDHLRARALLVALAAASPTRDAQRATPNSRRPTPTTPNSPQTHALSCTSVVSSGVWGDTE